MAHLFGAQHHWNRAHHVQDHHTEHGTREASGSSFIMTQTEWMA